MGLSKLYNRPFSIFQLSAKVGTIKTTSEQMITKFTWHSTYQSRAHPTNECKLFGLSVVTMMIFYNVERCKLWGSVWKCHCFAHWEAAGQIILFPLLLSGPFTAFEAASYPLHLQLKVCTSTRLRRNNQRLWKLHCLHRVREACRRTGGSSVETVRTTPMKNCRSIKPFYRLQLPLLPWVPHPSPLEYVCQQLCTSGWTTDQHG